MYPIYIEQLPYQRHQSQLSVDDYAQIQHLLYQEQRERAALHMYHQEQEKRRLQRAMYKLQVLTELQRRREQEELAIRAYYENKRQQAALMRHRLLLQKQEEERRSRLQKKQVEEAFYAAFIEHHQNEQQQQLLLSLAQQEHTAKNAGYANPCQALAEAVADAQSEQTEEEDDDISEPEIESEQNDLEALVKYLLAPEDNGEEVKIAASASEPELNQDQQQPMTLDEFVDYISMKSKQLDDRDEKNNQQEQVDEADINYSQIASTTNNQDDTMKEQQEENLTALDFEQVQVNKDSMDEDDDSIPDLVQSSPSLQNLVHDILTTTEYQHEFTKFAEEDPVKIAKFDALSRIEQELDTIRQQHEDYVLHATLYFPNDNGRVTPPNTILASTAENREFLGYEDQIMKVMLKLDMIESDGDENIRNERKALVKCAEAMLAKLDEYKQKEWERSQSDQDEDME